MAELPIACTLAPEALAERRENVLDALARKALERREVEGGYALRFAPEPERVLELARVVEMERACCAFLRFRITVEPAGGPVWLEMTGTEGTKEFLASLFA